MEENGGTAGLPPTSVPSIAVSANQSLISFQQCLQAAANIHPRELSLVDDQLARFSTWATSIGVFASGRASMDHRLRYTPDVSKVVTGLLDGLNYRIRSCTSVLETGATISVYDADAQLQQALSNIATEISHLNKLTNTIRRAGKDTQNLRASNFRMLDDEGNDVEPTLLANFEYYITNRFRDCSETIQKRLASGMLLRRKRIFYRRQRQGTAAIKPLETVAQAPVTLPSAQMAVDKKRSGRRRNSGAEGTLVQSQVMSATTLESAKFKMAALNPSLISASKTVALGSHELLTFPIAPGYSIKLKYNAAKKKLLEDYRHAIELGKPKLEANIALNESLRAVLQDIGEIPCPYCFYALPAEEVFDEHKWHRHVKNDLDPYICLFEDCPHPDKLYSHSEEWRDHLHEHAKFWQCLSHPELGAFSTRDEFIQHIRDVHNSNLSDAQLRILANRNGKKKQNLFSSCPLCGQDANEIEGDLEHHITGHLRSLALKSLPTYQEANEDMEIDENSHTVSQPLSRSTLRDAEFSDGRLSNAAEFDIVLGATEIGEVQDVKAVIDALDSDSDDDNYKQAFDASQTARSPGGSSARSSVHERSPKVTDEMETVDGAWNTFADMDFDIEPTDLLPANHKPEPQPSQPSRQVPTRVSSYWSVSERNDFPDLLKRFGSDWTGMATQLGTKTAAMVKNYYMRKNDSDHPEWSILIEEADKKKREAVSSEANNLADEPLQRAARAGGQISNATFHTMLDTMTPEDRQHVSSMPPDKINDVFRRWQRLRQEQDLIDEEAKVDSISHARKTVPLPTRAIDSVSMEEQGQPTQLMQQQQLNNDARSIYQRLLQSAALSYGGPENIPPETIDNLKATSMSQAQQALQNTINQRRAQQQQAMQGMGMGGMMGQQGETAAPQHAGDNPFISTSLPRGANASQPLRMKDLANEESDAEEEGGKIKCICNHSDDDGDIIYCETCDTWQHIECFYPDNQEEATREDFVHSCHDCKPRPLDQQRALRRWAKGKGKALEAQKPQKRQRKDGPSSEWQELIVASELPMAQSGGGAYRHWVRDQDLVAPLWEPSLGEIQTADSARRELSASEKRQVQQRIYQFMARYTSPPHPTSWQYTITVRERVSAVIDLIELGGAHPSSTDELNKLVERVCEFELQSFTDASTKDDYRLAVAREIMHMRANATN